MSDLWKHSDDTVQPSMSDDEFVAGDVWNSLDSAQREQLNQLLHQGPVYDGNLISKCARDALNERGLATRCCFRGEDGYNVATPDAVAVFRSGCDRPFQRKSGSPA